MFMLKIVFLLFKTDELLFVVCIILFGNGVAKCIMDGCTYKFELYAMLVDDGGSMFTILVTYDVYNEELYILSIIVSVLIILLLMLFMKWPFYHSPCSTISY